MANILKSRGSVERVKLKDLNLDPRNPRLPEDFQGSNQIDLAIRLELGFDAYTVAESIAAHGFFGSEPLIVVHENGEWLVVEGNRRLAALKGLADPALRDKFAHSQKWNDLAQIANISMDHQVPVVIHRDRSETTPIVGFRHISGILAWRPFAQARYVARLVDDENMTYSDVAKMIGLDLTRVRDLYRDQAIAKQAKDIGIDTGPIEDSFSLLTVAMRNTPLRAHVGADLGARLKPGEAPIASDKIDNFKEVITWIFGDRLTPPIIDDSRQITRLGSVVAHERGLIALREGETLDRANQRVKDAETDPRSRLTLRLRAGINALKAAEEDLFDFTEDAEIIDQVQEARAVVDGLEAAFEAPGADED